MDQPDTPLLLQNPGEPMSNDWPSSQSESSTGSQAYNIGPETCLHLLLRK